MIHYKFAIKSVYPRYILFIAYLSESWKFAHNISIWFPSSATAIIFLFCRNWKYYHMIHIRWMRGQATSTRVNLKFGLLVASSFWNSLFTNNISVFVWTFPRQIGSYKYFIFNDFLSIDLGHFVYHFVGNFISNIFCLIIFPFRPSFSRFSRKTYFEES